MAQFPVIPETITVHLGPPESDVLNVTLGFADYIKNVASSEVYPTWPQSAIVANILAQISFALNRVYTEHYPSLGYDFDITNSTAFDQAFVPDRDIFENISMIVDGIFNNYLRRPGSVEPLFAAYCNGTTTTCDGLSQWGSVELANSGLDSIQILKTYYGDNIEVVNNAPVSNIEPSPPNVPLRLGSTGNDVRFIQVRLNRVSVNYPTINKIALIDGVYGVYTEAAVREFQRIFFLTVDGVVGRNTWYKLQFIYNGIKRISELESEGITYEEVSKQFPSTLSLGDSSTGVGVVQYYLRFIAEFNPAVSSPPLSEYYGPDTANSVSSFQLEYGITQTGIIDEDTWNVMFDVYYGIVQSLSAVELGITAEPFPGTFLKLGAAGEDVLVLQEYINTASRVFPGIPEITVTGTFDDDTRNAVFAVQSTFGLPINGIVGPLTWDALAETFEAETNGSIRSEGQFPGEVISPES